MLKCEKCGANVPNESKFCLNCGNRIDSSAPKHFSLDEIAHQQQMQEDSAFSITPDIPDDDPESYLPPIGAKEHSEIPKGEIDPEYFNHKPLPNIQAADPLELLDADTPELPPIGFSDQMQIEDIKMPEGIRHYHGSYAVPRNLQMQTAFPIAENGDTYSILSQAQMQRQVIDRQAHGDKEHFSVIPENMQIRFCQSPHTADHAFSFNNFFIDEYVPEKDIPPKVKKPKKVSIRRVAEQTEVPKIQPKPKLSLEKAPEIPQSKTSVPTVSLDKQQPVQTPEVKQEYPSFTPPAPSVSLEKQQPVQTPEVKQEYPSFTPPAPSVSLEKQQPVQSPDVPQEYQNFAPDSPAVSLEKQQPVQAPEIPREYQNFAPDSPAVSLEKTQNSFHSPPKNDFNFASPQQPENNFGNPEPPKENFNNNNSGNTQQEEFTFFSFTDPQNNNYQNDFNKPAGSSYSSPYQPRSYYHQSYVQTPLDRIFLISGLVLSVIQIILIIIMIVNLVSVFMKLASGEIFNGFSVSSNAEGITVGGFDADSTKYANLNSGGLAAEDGKGNVYYTNAKGCICKLSADGNTNIVYNASRTNDYILYINYHNDRLYFLASVTGTSLSLCSVDTDGKDLKVYTEAKNPACAIAHGNYIYYITEDAKRIDRIDLKTEKTQKFYSAGGSVINVFIAGDKMYVLSLNDTGSGGKIHSINLAAPSAVTALSFSYNGKDLEPMGMSLCGDRIVLTNNSKYTQGVVYSSDLNGNDVQKLGGMGIVKVSGYGDYIYYLSVNGDIMNAADAVVNKGQTTGIFTLGMMKSDGSASYTLKNDILYYSVAGDKIYYVGSSGGMFSMSANGTDSKAVS